MFSDGLRLALLGDAGHVNVQRWCEGLTKAGADVHLLSFRVDGSSCQKTHRLPAARVPGKLQYILAVPHVRRLIRRIQPDVVIAYYLTGYGVMGALASHRPLVLVSAGSDVLSAPKNLILRRLVCFALNRADLVTAWAPHLGEAVRKLGMAPERLFVLPRGIPVEQFAGARCPPPVDDETVNIITTRSLKRDYNAHLLLKALRVLQDRGIEAMLTLAGDGLQRRELVALAHELGVERRVRLVGFVPNDRLPRLLAEHNMYVSLIESDGVSASLLEAMVAGLLPIVHDNPANRWWITSEHNGLLVQDLWPSALAERIVQAASDLSLRCRAWTLNQEIVRSRADLFKNSAIFVDRFRALARQRCS